MSDKWEFRLGEANAPTCPDDCFGAIVYDDWVVAEIKSDIPDAQDKADYIVRALNSHDDLLVALKAWEWWFRQGEKAPLYRSNQAIKNAEEK